MSDLTPAVPSSAGRIEAAMPWSAIGHAASIAIPCLLLSLLYWDRPALLLTSDSLTPTEFLWDLFHRANVWGSFEQPHSPGFFPDETVLGIVQVLAGDWRAAMAAWVLMIFLGLVTLGAAAAGDLAQVRPARAIPAVLCVFLPLMTAAAFGSRDMEPDTGTQGPFFPWLLTLLPGGHGGNFLLAMAGGWFARRAARHRPTLGEMAGLTALAAAGVVSDQLTVIGLLAPATCALLASAWVGVVRIGAIARVLGALWYGALLGFIAGAMLDTQYMPRPTLASSLDHAVRFLSDLGRHWDMIAAAGLLAAGLGLHAWRAGPRAWMAGFWPMFAAVGGFGSLAFTAILFEDLWSFRYAMPLLWWSVFFCAAMLARTRPAVQGWRMAAVCLTGGLAVAWSTTGAHVPRLLVWDTPLSSCLTGQGLSAGLADFWIARKTGAASDWRLQIGVLNGLGAARVWGGDRSWYVRDIHDDARRPSFRFIVTDRLPEDRLTAVYGAPDRVTVCGPSRVWIYDDPDRLYDALRAVSPDLRDQFASGPAR